MKENNNTEIIAAYHRGYTQGRFEEYADRMGKERAEKVRARIEKQKNCPYCHPDKFNCTKPICDEPKNKLYVFPNGAIEMDYDDDDGPGAYFSESGLLDYCPVCGRSLGKEED